MKAYTKALFMISQLNQNPNSLMLDFATQTDDQLLLEYAAEITQAERWKAKYIQQPCVRHYHWFEVHRQIVELIAKEFTDREANTDTITTILSSAGVSFKVLKNQVIILP